MLSDAVVEETLPKSKIVGRKIESTMEVPRNWDSSNHGRQKGDKDKYPLTVELPNGLRKVATQKNFLDRKGFSVPNPSFLATARGQASKLEGSEITILPSKKKSQSKQRNIAHNLIGKKHSQPDHIQSSRTGGYMFNGTSSQPEMHSGDTARRGQGSSSRPHTHRMQQQPGGLLVAPNLTSRGSFGNEQPGQGGSGYLIHQRTRDPPSQGGSSGNTKPHSLEHTRLRDKIPEGIRSPQAEERKSWGKTHNGLSKHPPSRDHPSKKGLNSASSTMGKKKKAPTHVSAVDPVQSNMIIKRALECLKKEDVERKKSADKEIKEKHERISKKKLYATLIRQKNERQTLATNASNAGSAPPATGASNGFQTMNGFTTMHGSPHWSTSTAFSLTMQNFSGAEPQIKLNQPTKRPKKPSHEKKLEKGQSGASQTHKTPNNNGQQPTVHPHTKEGRSSTGDDGHSGVSAAAHRAANAHGGPAAAVGGVSADGVHHEASKDPIWASMSGSHQAGSSGHPGRKSATKERKSAGHTTQVPPVPTGFVPSQSSMGPLILGTQYTTSLGSESKRGTLPSTRDYGHSDVKKKAEETHGSATKLKPNKKPKNGAVHLKHPEEGSDNGPRISSSVVNSSSTVFRHKPGKKLNSEDLFRGTARFSSPALGGLRPGLMMSQLVHMAKYTALLQNGDPGQLGATKKRSKSREKKFFGHRNGVNKRRTKKRGSSSDGNKRRDLAKGGSSGGNLNGVASGKIQLTRRGLPNSSSHAAAHLTHVDAAGHKIEERVDMINKDTKVANRHAHRINSSASSLQGSEEDPNQAGQGNRLDVSDLNSNPQERSSKKNRSKEPSNYNQKKPNLTQEELGGKDLHAAHGGLVPQKPGNSRIEIKGLMWDAEFNNPATDENPRRPFGQILFADPNLELMGTESMSGTIKLDDRIPSSANDQQSSSGQNPHSSKLSEVFQNYQAFAKEQFNKWNEIRETIEAIKSSRLKDPQSLNNELSKLKLASEMNANYVKSNLEEIKHITKGSLLSSNNPNVRRPIRAGEMPGDRQMQLQDQGHNPNGTKSRSPDRPLDHPEEPDAQLGSRVLRQQTGGNGGVQNDSTTGVAGFNPGSNVWNNNQTNGTPSQSVSHRKSFEKWMYPDPKDMEKNKLDMAKALLNEGATTDARVFKKRSSQDFRLKGLNDSKSLKSEKSVDDYGVLDSGQRARSGVIPNKVATARGYTSSGTQIGVSPKSDNTLSRRINNGLDKDNTKPSKDEVLLEDDRAEDGDDFDDQPVVKLPDPASQKAPETQKVPQLDGLAGIDAGRPKSNTVIPAPKAFAEDTLHEHVYSTPEMVNRSMDEDANRGGIIFKVPHDRGRMSPEQSDIQQSPRIKEKPSPGQEDTIAKKLTERFEGSGHLSGQHGSQSFNRKKTLEDNMLRQLHGEELSVDSLTDSQRRILQEQYIKEDAQGVYADFGNRQNQPEEHHDLANQSDRQDQGPASPIPHLQSPNSQVSSFIGSPSGQALAIAIAPQLGQFRPTTKEAAASTTHNGLTAIAGPVSSPTHPLANLPSSLLDGNRITIENRDINSLNDLIDTGMLPNFDKDSKSGGGFATPSVPSYLNNQQQALVPAGPQTSGTKSSTPADKHADEITHAVLSTLLEELVVDGFVMNALMKLQPEPPRGIKTNINCVKNYLSSLTEYILSRFWSDRQRHTRITSSSS